MKKTKKQATETFVTPKPKPKAASVKRQLKVEVQVTKKAVDKSSTKGSGGSRGKAQIAAKKQALPEQSESDTVRYPDLVRLTSLTVTTQEKEMEKVPLTKSKSRSIRESGGNASEAAAKKKPNRRDDSIVWRSSFSFQSAILT